MNIRKKNNPFFCYVLTVIRACYAIRPALWLYNETAEEWIMYSARITGKDAYALTSEATCPGVGWTTLGGVPGEITFSETEELLIISEESGTETASVQPDEPAPVPEETATPFGVAGLLAGFSAAVYLRRKI